MRKQIKVKLEYSTSFFDYKVKSIINAVTLTIERNGKDTEVKVGDSLSKEEAEQLNDRQFTEVQVSELN